MSADRRPLICIVDGAIDRTGGLMAARREAAALRDVARFMIVIPQNGRVQDCDLPEFERVVRLPIVHLRKSWRDVLLYLPCLFATGRRLTAMLQLAGCTRLQINDFTLMQGAAARWFGFDGCIATWVRMDPRRFGAIGRFWLDRASAASDHMIAVSQFIRGVLPADVPATLIYDPAPEIAPSPNAPTSQRFLFIGNYIVGKGQDLAIEAFHTIAGDFPNAELVFHGSDMGLAKNRLYRQRLDDLARTGPGTGRIQLRDYLCDPTRAYASSLAALNCSSSESFSLTCQEASAHGIAVIATQSGGPQEIIADGQTGFLIPIGHAPALADCMRRLLADPGMAAEMGKAGAKLMRERFGTQHFRQQLTGLFGLEDRDRRCP